MRSRASARACDPRRLRLHTAARRVVAAACHVGWAVGERDRPGLELGLHLPLIEFGDEGQALARLCAAVDAARESGFAAASANDHFVFQTPWLDGATALAAVIERAGAMELATTVANVALRGPVPLAKTLAALDVLSDDARAGVDRGDSRTDEGSALDGNNQPGCGSDWTRQTSSPLTGCTSRFSSSGLSVSEVVGTPHLACRQRLMRGTLESC